MSAVKYIRGVALDCLVAIQFLTRFPVPDLPYDTCSLSRAVKFFPLVGLLIGSAASLVHLLLAPHLPRLVTALLVIAFLVSTTGCLHEDGLADAADGFGGGTSRERILLILKDSRIGSYGGAALSLSLLARVCLLAALPLPLVPQYLIASHVLCRWTTLPLSYYLSPARHQSQEGRNGQGARIARLTTRGALVVGSGCTLAICILVLRTHALAAIGATVLVTLITAIYYQRKLDGLTGDCFGATNQLAEIAVYLTGAWVL
jgi:adenosylcobinamide-GDP ribazoletransferase